MELHYCQRLLARITERTCESNRKVIGSCVGCKGLMKEESMGKRREIICKSCGKPSTNFSRGLCGVCYHAHRESGTLEQFPTGAEIVKAAAVEPVVAPVLGISPELAASVAACLEPVVTDADRDDEELPALARLLSSAPPRPCRSIVLDLSGEPGLADALSSKDIGEPEIIELLGYLVAGELQRVVAA